ncbi:methylmalonyl-CoA mutase family protein [Halalkalibacter nanhaiisediminis]|uniref:methylmalonyl-CoA mutase n=1 Tax=Halalkalibacter nanhaiisediminis TaxID=688079 RepID=A0A562QK90_9BACI|nr:methylmalonyl-CoA mutase family protein [Halalkalibacter nanhaiisediminis]TWI57172.1 methylmalonyl-CoA mutase [Halalkalibacter nanhaiisediminis]
MEKNRDLEKFCEFTVPTYEQWRSATEKSLKGKSFDTLVTKLMDDILIEPMYQERDIDNLSIKADQPGQFPYTRGTRNERFTWKVSQELAASTPQLLNEIAKHDMARGQNVYHIILDDDLKQAKEASLESNAQRGVPLYDLDDVKALFDGIDVTAQPIHLDTGEVNIPLLAAISTLLERKVEIESLTGIIAADPIHQLAKTGRLTYSLDQTYNHLTTAVTWAKEQGPSLRTVLVQTYAYHNGGASPAVELASALSTGVAYVQALLERGVQVDDASKAIAFAFSIGSDYFSEIAKIRAARTLWAAIMAEFGASKEAQKMSVHARTSAFTKTAQDTYVNILRGTSEAFAAAVAGVDSLHVSALDEAIQTPSSFSRRIARNTSLILQEEAHIDKTLDPAGGSWYVEYMTDQLAKKAWGFFQEIERAGGIIAALQEEVIQKWINQAWEERLVKVENRKQTIVGVNQFVNLDEKAAPKPSDQLEQERKRYQKELEKKQTKTFTGLNKPESFAEVSQLLQEGVPFSVIHELIGAHDKNGVTITSIPSRRLSEPFEQLRKRSEDLSETNEKRPTAYLLGLGSLASHKARTDFITGFFQSGGFDVQVSNPIEMANQAVQAANEFNLIVLCGKDEDYQEQAATIVEQLKQKNEKRKVFIAGRPQKEQETKLQQAGVDDFIHIKTNVYQFLYDLQEWLKGGGK